MAAASRSRAAGEERYALPPLRVMLALESEEECTAAVLQPLYEAGFLSLAALVAAGFAPAVIRAVDAMTPRPGETRLDSAARASTDPIARTVRLVECTEEMDFTGLPGLSASEYALIEEYRLVREVLVAGALHDPVHHAAALPEGSGRLLEGEPARPRKAPAAGR